MGFERILVGVDFAPASIVALRRAKALASARGTVRLFHAIDVPPRVRAAGGADGSEIARAARERLETLARELESAGIRVEVETRPGRPADEIVAATERARADLVVVGSHARGRLGRLVLGSVAEEVARTSVAPVLVVRDTAGGGPYVWRVVLAVDDTPPSSNAARAGADLARALSAPLEAIHVIELPLLARLVGPLPFPEEEVPPEVLRELGCTVEQDIARALDGAAPKVRFLAGDPAREIVRFVRPNDVLVCGTHGRSAFSRVAFGSVATKLIRRAPCPVLVVRPSGSTVEPPEPEPSGARSAR